MKKLLLLTAGVFIALDYIYGWSVSPIVCVLADPITGAIGGALGIAQGLFGSGTSQDQTQQTRTVFRPEDLAQIEAARGGLQTQVGDLMSQLGRSREALQTGIRLPSGEFSFATSPDAITRALAAQATQGIGQQVGAQQRQIAQQFRGAPGASRALQAQAAMQGRLAANPLLFQAFQQQQGRELQQAQQAQAAAEAVNRALLGREQAITGLAQTGMGAQQNLLSTLLSLGQGLGTQVQSGQMKGRSGGLFS